MSMIFPSDPQSHPDRTIRRTHGKIRTPPPIFAPLLSNPERQAPPTPNRSRRHDQPEMAWSSCRNSLEVLRTDWPPTQEYSVFSRVQIEVFLRKPPPSRKGHRFRWNEIHPGSGEARWPPQSCIPPQHPNDMQA